MLVVITEPTADPVTTAWVKTHSRIDGSADDSMIAQFITTATNLLEETCGVKLMSQTVELRLDKFLDSPFELDCWPIQSVTSVKYDDSDGDEQTLAAGKYDTDLSTWRGRIRATDTWPSTKEGFNRVRIRMVAGYATADDVPDKFKQGITLLAAHWYENREAPISGTIHDIPYGVRALVMPARTRWVG